MAERALLEALGGTCHSPIAVLSKIKSGMLTMKASLFSAEGNERVDGEIKCDPHDQDAARTLGRDLLSRAASPITVLFNGQS